MADGKVASKQSHASENTLDFAEAKSAAGFSPSRQFQVTQKGVT